MEAAGFNLEELLGGRICCLACCLKVSGFDIPMIEFMQSNDHEVNELREGTAVWIWVTSQGFDQDQMNRIIGCRDALVQSHAPRDPPLMHSRYWQREEFQIRCQYGNYAGIYGSIKRGNVLEIFQRDPGCQMGKAVLNNLKQDFLEIIQKPNQYNELHKWNCDKFMSVSFKTGKIEVGLSLRGKPSFYCIETDQWSKSTWKEQKQHVKSFVFGLERLSMVVIECAITPEDRILTTKRICSLMEKVRGSIDDLLIVVVFTYADFRRIKKMTSKRTARKKVNQITDEELIRKIFWVDTSSTDDNINAYEFGKSVSWNLQSALAGFE